MMGLEEIKAANKAAGWRVRSVAIELALVDLLAAIRNPDSDFATLRGAIEEAEKALAQ